MTPTAHNLTLYGAPHRPRGTVRVRRGGQSQIRSDQTAAVDRSDQTRRGGIQRKPDEDKVRRGPIKKQISSGFFERESDLAHQRDGSAISSSFGYALGSYAVLTYKRALLVLVCGRRPPHITRDLGRGDGSPCVAYLGLEFAPSVVVVEQQHAPGLPCCCVTPSVCSSLSRSRYERTKQKEIAGASRCAVVLLPLRPWRRSCPPHCV